MINSMGSLIFTFAATLQSKNFCNGYRKIKVPCLKPDAFSRALLPDFVPTHFRGICVLHAENSLHVPVIGERGSSALSKA